MQFKQTKDENAQSLRRRSVKRWWQPEGAQTISYIVLLAEAEQPHVGYHPSQHHEVFFGRKRLEKTKVRVASCKGLTVPKPIHPAPQAPLCEVILHASETRQTLCFVTACMVILFQLVLYFFLFLLKRLTGGFSSLEATFFL